MWVRHEGCTTTGEVNHRDVFTFHHSPSLVAKGMSRNYTRRALLDSLVIRFFAQGF